MTVSDIECVAYARDRMYTSCRVATDPKVKETLLQLAREWMADAMHRARTARTKSAF